MLPLSFHLTILLLSISLILIIIGLYILFVPNPVSVSSSFNGRKNI